ncbi:MAG TPA: hypothetical protein VGK36_09495 [Candidatus Angelobacter sp.]|jgi:hypothetical protein
MARKKTARKPVKKRAIAKRSSPKKKAPAKKKAAVKTKPARKSVAKKKVSARKPARRKSGARSGASRGADMTYPTPVGRRGLGAQSAGQSGDTQGLSRREFDDSESVEELLEEGQYAEAEAVSGVENAPDADESEVHTSEVLEDDVPEEYTDRDE